MRSGLRIKKIKRKSPKRQAKRPSREATRINVGLIYRTSLKPFPPFRVIEAKPGEINRLITR